MNLQRTSKALKFNHLHIHVLFEINETINLLTPWMEDEIELWPALAAPSGGEYI